MWYLATRRQHSRVGLGHGAHLTDAEWVLIEPLLPPPPEYGRPRFWPMRAIMNAIFYVLRGIAWRLPTGPAAQDHRLSLVQSVARHPAVRDVEPLLVMADREQVGREASPPAAVVLGSNPSALT